MRPGTWQVVDMELETFGQRLRRLRKAANLSQRGLAAKAGLAHHTGISLVESARGRSKSPPSSTITQALADALGVTRDYLEKGDPGTPVEAAGSGAGVRDAVDERIVADLMSELREVAPHAALDTLRAIRETEPPAHYRAAVRAYAQAFRTDWMLGDTTPRSPRREDESGDGEAGECLADHSH